MSRPRLHTLYWVGPASVSAVSRNATLSEGKRIIRMSMERASHLKGEDTGAWDHDVDAQQRTHSAQICVLKLGEAIHADLIQEITCLRYEDSEGLKELLYVADVEDIGYTASYADDTEPQRP